MNTLPAPPEHRRPASSALGAAGVGYAALVERNAFTLRRFSRAGAARRARPAAGAAPLRPAPDARPAPQDRVGARRWPALRARPGRQHRRQPRAPRRGARRCCARWSRCWSAPARSSWGPTTTSRPKPKNPALLPHPRHAARRPARRRGCPPTDLRQGADATPAGRTSTNARADADGGRARRSSSSASTTRTSSTTATPRWPGPPTPRRALTIGRDPRALPAGPRRDDRRRRAGWSSPATPTAASWPALLRRAGDQLRPRPRPGQGRLAVVARRRTGTPSTVARPADAAWLHVSAGLGHLAVRAGAVRLPARGDAADPACAPLTRSSPTGATSGPPVTSAAAAAGTAPIGRAGRGRLSSVVAAPVAGGGIATGCGAAW